MAFEAARAFCRGKSVQSIELSNVNILRPIVLDETSDGSDTLFSVRSNIDAHNYRPNGLLSSDEFPQPWPFRKCGGAHHGLCTRLSGGLDRRFYLKDVWCQEMLSGALCTPSDYSIAAPEKEWESIDACERVVHYYLSKIKVAGHFGDAVDKSPGLRSLISAMEARTTSTLTQHDLVSILEDIGEHIDIVLIRTIGEGLLKTRNDSLRPMSQGFPSSMAALISRWLNEGLGILQLQRHFVSAAKQISHQHVNLKVLQIGPSAPRLVRSICHELGRGLEKYTVVGDSAHSIEEMKIALAQDQLQLNISQASVEDKIDKVNDLTTAGSFDLVFVHRAFMKQAAALMTIRALLRPGGFMLIMAATGAQLRFPFMLLSALPSLDEVGLAHTRFINSTRKETHNLLRQAGFSGVDAIALDNVFDKHTFSVVVSPALDDHISFLPPPLTSTSPTPLRGDLLVVGASSEDIAKIVESIQAQMSNIWQGDIVNVRSLAELSDEASSVEAVLSLTVLDRPVLEDIRAPTYEGLQQLFFTAKTVLWITQRARGGNPYHNAPLALVGHSSPRIRRGWFSFLI
ncbi:hypothetical protein BDW67DRAFT_188526 [Aspergillus spinulosporus]